MEGVINMFKKVTCRFYEKAADKCNDRYEKYVYERKLLESKIDILDRKICRTIDTRQDLLTKISNLKGLKN